MRYVAVALLSALMAMAFDMPAGIVLLSLVLSPPALFLLDWIVDVASRVR